MQLEENDCEMAAGAAKDRSGIEWEADALGTGAGIRKAWPKESEDRIEASVVDLAECLARRRRSTFRKTTIATDSRDDKLPWSQLKD